jgi:hypothetical protein
MGDTNLDTYTFGIDGTQERVERALPRGYHTGFSREAPGG